MAKRISLREFQERVTQRLQSASAGAGTLSRLGVRVGDRHFLLDLTEVSEVIPVPTIADVPLTRDWYRGVTNIRGTLYSVTDLSQFLGGAPTAVVPNTRLLLLQPRLVDNASLMVSQIVGLRQVAQLTPLDKGGDAQAWLGERWQDGQGVEWQELSLERLVREADFLQINRFQ